MQVKPYDVFGCILLVVVAIVGCRANQPDALTEPVELTYATFFYGGGENESEQALLDLYEAEHPNVRVTVESYRMNDFQNLLNAEKPPDVISLPLTQFIGTLVEEGALLDLSDMSLQTNQEDNFSANFLAMGQWDGKQYYLPVAHSWTAVYYNLRLFEENELAPPRTWSDFLDVARTLAEKGITPIADHPDDIYNRTLWLDYLVLRLHGPEFHRQFVAGQIPYDDPRVREVFETWGALIAADYFATDRDLPARFYQVTGGSAGMTLADSTEFGGELPELRELIAFFPFPEVDPEIPVGEDVQVFGFAVSAGTEHPQAAVDLLSFLVSQEGQTAIMQQFPPSAGILPVNPQIDVPALFPEAEQGWNLIGEVDRVVQPSITNLGGTVDAQAFVLALNTFYDDPEQLDAILAELETERQRVHGN